MINIHTKKKFANFTLLKSCSETTITWNFTVSQWHFFEAGRASKLNDAQKNTNSNWRLEGVDIVIFLNRASDPRQLKIIGSFRENWLILQLSFLTSLGNPIWNYAGLSQQPHCMISTCNIFLSWFFGDLNFRATFRGGKRLETNRTDTSAIRFLSIRTVFAIW